jgi:hypothetical protein
MSGFRVGRNVVGWYIDFHGHGDAKRDGT